MQDDLSVVACLTESCAKASLLTMRRVPPLIHLALLCSAAGSLLLGLAGCDSRESPKKDEENASSSVVADSKIEMAGQWSPTIKSQLAEIAKVFVKPDRLGDGEFFF